MTQAVKNWRVLGSDGQTVSSMQLQRKAMMMNYIGADSGRIFGEWSATGNSADTTLSWDRATLVKRTRERLRNDPMIRGMVRRLLDNVIGRGIRMEADLDAPALGISEDQAREYEALINAEQSTWINECDYSGNEARRWNLYDIQSALYQSELSNGENFILPRYVKRLGYRYSFCIQVIETDRVVTPSTVSGAAWLSPVKLDNGNEVRDGIELGSRGEIQAIHVANQHPGDFNSIANGYEVRRIPTYNRLGLVNFWHVFPWYRLEATRGEPGLAACLSGARQLGDYIGFELLRAEMAAMFGLVMTQDKPFDTTDDLASADRMGTDREKDREQVELYPGMVQYAPPGFTANVVNPNMPGDNFDTFVERIATFIGGSQGLVRELVMGSFDKSNFSNTRAALQLAQRGFEATRARFIGKYLEPLRERFMNEAVWTRRLVLPGWDIPEKRALWMGYRAYGPPWPYMEPVRDQQAIELRLKTTGTLSEECSAQGKNWRDTLRQQAVEKAFRIAEEKRLGVYEDPNANKPQNKKQGENSNAE